MSISLEQISKHYSGRPAVNDVSVEIADGELFVLLGPSGSGKSTLLRAIAGLTTIDHGRIMMHGRDVTSVSARDREVGFVFQNYALFRHMTIADNIEFALRVRRVPAAQRRKRRSELLALVSLEGFDGRYPAELSGGQQQRVAVARALAHEPRVLLLDEPFGALDAKIRDELRRAVREIQRAVGITTVLVTHDQEEAFTMADRIGVMDRGRLQEVGEPRVLYRQPATRFVATFLGAANLLLGCYREQSLLLGEAGFPVDRWSRSLRRGDEAAVVVRPEDVVVAEHAEQLAAPMVCPAEVVEAQFVGSVERLKLSVTASETLASARRPGMESFILEASRGARDVEESPFSIGQRVWVGFKGVRLLPTPISSLRIAAPSVEAFDRLAATALMRELTGRMNTEPTLVESGNIRESGLRGLVVVAMQDAGDFAEALGLLDQGARQVLVLLPTGVLPRKMLIYVEPSSVARNAALAAAASLARHLTVDVAMLLRDDEQSARITRYRELLDLRNASLKLHGLDIRTETFVGSLVAAVNERQSSSGEALLVLGIASPASSSRLMGELAVVLGEARPAAVLLVSGRSEQAAGRSLATDAPVALAGAR